MLEKWRGNMKILKNILRYRASLFGFFEWSFKAGYFIIQDLKQNPLEEYLSTDRKPFYKIFHLTSGRGLLVTGMNEYHVKGGDIAFLPPGESIYWRSLSSNLDGHFCFIHPRFFNKAGHVLKLFLSFPYIHPSFPVVELNETQSGKVQQHFEMIHREALGQFENKKQAILIHLQMILLKVKRAGDL